MLGLPRKPGGSGQEPRDVVRAHLLRCQLKSNRKPLWDWLSAKSNMMDYVRRHRDKR
jgi:hypothetical protein